ncbi:hypothetical protein, partial [Acetobacter farinalis]
STSKKPVCFMIHAPNQLKGNGITEQLSKPGGFSNPPPWQKIWGSVYPQYPDLYQCHNLLFIKYRILDTYRGDKLKRNNNTLNIY